MSIVNHHAHIGEWSPGSPFIVLHEPESIEFSSLETWEAFELGRALAAWAGVATAAGWAAVSVELAPEPLVEDVDLVGEAPPADTPSAPAPAAEVPPAESAETKAKRIEAAQNQLQKFISWGKRSGEGDFDGALAALIRAAGSEEAAKPFIEAAGARGREILDASNGFEAFLKLHDPESLESRDEKKRLQRAYPEAYRKFAKLLEWRKGELAKARDEQQRRQNKRPLSSVVASADVTHRVDHLPPAASWTVFVDETGRFEEAQAKSIVVGLFVPDGVELPTLPAGWHATAMLPDQIDHALQRVLDAPVGILGVKADRESWIGLDPWLGTVLGLIEAAIRLMPMPIEGRSRVEFRIEQRGDVRPDGRFDERPLCAAMVQLLRDLQRRHPLRAAAFDVRAVVVPKNTPLLAYADAIACTLGSTTSEAKARRAQSGLDGFVLGASSGQLAYLLDYALLGETVIEPAQWRQAVELGDSAPIALRDALERLATEVRTGTIPIAPFVLAVQAHLDSKAVDRSALGRELAWLEGAHGNVTLPGTFALELALARQEALNHRGAFDADVESELGRWARALVDEVPERACQADLVLAVSETNRFRFHAAEQRLLPWLAHPIAVPGLQHHGRVWSSLGQHAAFRGESSLALQRLDTALAHFERLSDPTMSRLERSHTACYRFVAAVDDPGLEDDDVHGAFFDYASLLVPSLSRDPTLLLPAVSSAVIADDGHRLDYLHHVLVRYLWQRGTEVERAAYLSRREQWNQGFGHPWQLIEGYRALLLADSPLAAEHGQEHAWRCEELSVVIGAGPTLGYIGLAFADVLNEAGYLVRFDVDHYRTRHRSLRESLPDAPWSAWEDLHEHSPRERLKRLLPFNFR